MKLLKKALLAIACIISSFSALACNSNANNTGIDFTFVALDDTEAAISASVKFNYEGSNLDVYWSDTGYDKLNHHAFNSEAKNRFFIIYGNITSISFCDESGNLLAENNSLICTVFLSNTISSIHQKAFLNTDVYMVIIPNSVKNIGAEAFNCTSHPITFVCSATSKPEGWDNNWVLDVQSQNVYMWGVTFYTLNSCLYILIDDNENKTASALLCYDDRKDFELNIPNVISNGNNNYKVTNIMDGFACLVTNELKKVIIPSNVTTISTEAFMHCTKLEEISFSNNSCLKTIANHAFFKSGLKKITIPKSVSFVGNDAFAFSQLTDVYLTNYTKSSEIASCENDAFTIQGSGRIIRFHHNKELDKSHFIDKGWPSNMGKEHYIWIAV